MLMEEDQEQSKHMCKFCSKSFPSGRSLGGHMRSHLVSVTSSDRSKSKQKLPKEKTIKALNPCEEDSLLEEKKCRECGKRFHSWKALFGHMKCHSVNGRTASSVVKDSWDSSKQITDSLSDNEAATSLHSIKQSNRIKRYTANLSSSSLISQSEIEQMEQEEVALSLIILSRDKGDWSSLNSVIESSDNISALSQPKKDAKASGKNSKNSHGNCSKFKKRKCINTVHGFDSSLPVNYKNPTLAHSPSDSKLNHNKLRCSVSKKGFPSYQVLGGHQASNKKLKGSFAPRSKNSLESETPPNQSTENMTDIASPKEHECTICFKVFSSGQALGGHKRSHLTNDQIKSNPSIGTQKLTPPDTRSFLDLNLPAPDEEECTDYKPCWITTGHQHELLLTGLLCPADVPS